MKKSEQWLQVLELFKETSLESLFNRAFGKRKAKSMIYGTKKNNYQSDTTEYAVIYNPETEDLFILSYATENNGWANTYCSQNLGFLVCYACAMNVHDTDILYNHISNVIEHFLHEEAVAD